MENTKAPTKVESTFCDVRSPMISGVARGVALAAAP